MTSSSTISPSSRAPESLVVLVGVLLVLLCLFLRAFIDGINRFPYTMFRSNTWFHIALLQLYHWSSLGGALLVGWFGSRLFWNYIPLPIGKWRTLVNWLLLVAILPALGYLLLFLFAIAIFVYPDGMQVFTTVDQYEVALYQRRDPDPDHNYTTLDIMVIRQDQAYYRVELDERDADAGEPLWTCRTLSTYAIGTRVYLRCNNEPITSQTTYVDSTRATIYIGWGLSSVEQPLDTLSFVSPFPSPCTSCIRP